MLEVARDVDSLLRGRYTRPADLRAGRIDAPVRRLLLAALLMGAVYGGFMGVFAALRGGPDGIRQLGASVVKVPLLFLMTLLVTFPSLYVSSALSDSRLDAAATLRLLLTAIAVELALLASLGPVTAFFSLCTTSYPFMVLLNVLVFALSGVAALSFLKRALASVFGPPSSPPPPPAAIPAPPAESLGEAAPLHALPALPTRPAAAAIAAAASVGQRRVFTVWLLIFAVVGAQMGWILRPFIGDPRLPFTFFRARQSNFFEACLRALHELTQ